MESRTISCKVITPMFSYGGNSAEPELRPTELKGLMRYVYRITQQNVCSEELFTKESKLFGSTAIPSPIRLTMEFKEHKDIPKPLMTHKKCAEIKCINIDSTFNIILGYRDRECTDADKQLYYDILRLSLYLSGMGKRTRRARGCVCIEGKEKTKYQIIKDIYNLLNSVAKHSENDKKEIYVKDDHCIKPKMLLCEKRPVIQKICFGDLVHSNSLDKFLLAVDKTSHETKLYITNLNDREAKSDDPTGTTNRASSIIVSVAKTTEGYLPIYTYIRAINKYKKEIDCNLSEREEFQNKIEIKTKNGGK